MIYLDGIGLSFLVKEVKDKILNYRLTKIYQYDRSSFSFYFGKNNLLFQIKDNSTIFYIKDKKDLNTDFQSKFLLTMKKYLLNSILINIRQEDYDRIIYFDFEKLNQFGDIEKYTLIMEIMGKASNIFLVDGYGKILTTMYFTGVEIGNRVVMTGAKYELPFEKTKLSPLYIDEENYPKTVEEFIENVDGVGKIFAQHCIKDIKIFKQYLSTYIPTFYTINNNNKTQSIMTYNNFDDFEMKIINKISYNTITEGLNEYFKATITSNVINEKKKKLLKYVDAQIKKNSKILMNIEVDKNKNLDYENYKNVGDILAANMHILKYGMETIKAYDFYNNKDVVIKLDPLLSPNDNLNIYYNKYNKGKRTIIALEKRHKDVESELKYFEKIKYFLEKEDDFIGIEEIEDELNLSGNNKTKIKLNKSKKRELLSFDYNGFKIFVGRNNKENEEITFSKGQINDIWLHIKDIPGSHVVIIKNNKEITEDVIIYASNLAASYSKAKKGDKVIVDYCEKKYVKKIKNSNPGNVTYTNFKSLDIVIN